MKAKIGICLSGMFVAAAVSLAAGEPSERGPGPERSAPAASPEFAKALRGIFDEGLNLGPKRQASAERHLATARRFVRDDPRLDYAWGLVLAKQSQLKPAAAAFESAARHPGEFCWPAWQALIWVELVDKQYEKALGRLVEFAALVQKAESSDEVTEPQRIAARWIGEVLEALNKTVTAKKTRELVAEHETRVLASLGDDLSEAVDEGRESIGGIDFELGQQNDVALRAAKRKKEQRRDDQSNKLGKNLDDLDKEKKNAARSAEEWKKWLDDTLAKVDKQLGLLEKDYQFLEKRAQSLLRSMDLTGKELTSVQINRPDPSVNSLGAAQVDQRVMQLQNQAANYQLEYNATTMRMVQTAQQGQLVMRERAAVVDRYEKATGQLVKKSAELEKWSDRLADKKKKLESQPVAKAAKAKGADKKVPASFRSYVPVDFEREKERVLDSFGVGSGAGGSDSARAAG